MTMRARPVFFHLLSALLIVGASGVAGGADQLDPATPSRKPDAQDLLKATAPGYATPAGMLRECLGRLVFDVHQPVQWPTAYGDASDTKLFYRAFSEDVFHQGDEIRVGNVRIGVQGPMSKEQLAALHDSLPEPSIVQMQGWLKETTAELADLKKQPLTAKTRNAMALAEDAIVSRQAQIKQLQTDYQAFDSGLPDSEGYRTAYNASHDESVRYSVYRSHLKRGQYVYVFESEEKLGPANSEQAHGQRFIAFLKSFRPRAANEVPKDLGICIPYGFIADDGKTTSEIKQSLRWPDALGVLYTISTGNVDARSLKSPVVTAAATAGVGMFGTKGEAQAKPFISERIGPRVAKIGSLTAQQGGIAFNIKRPGKAPFEAYTVFTGYSGWLGTAVLPYILIELNTRTIEQAAELAKNPPPFKTSFARLESLLKSTHLRPTDPLMPELRSLQMNK